MWGLLIGMAIELLNQLLLKRLLYGPGGRASFAIAIVLPMLYLPPLLVMAFVSVPHLLWTAAGMLLAKLFFVLRTVVRLRRDHAGEGR